MKTEIENILLEKYGKKNPAPINVGDTVKIHQKIREGEKERVQVFEGLVIAKKHGEGLNGTFTVRKIAAGGVGVEKVFPVHSPNIVKIERVKTAEVSRAKLYYMRDRLGKSARFKKEAANPGMWDESAAVEAARLAKEAAENPETEEVVEEMIEGVELVDEVAAPEVEAEVTEEAAVEAPAEEVATEEVAEAPAEEEDAKEA